MYIVLRPHMSLPGCWTVRVLNFATFKHLHKDFTDEATARKYADLWRI